MDPYLVLVLVLLLYILLVGGVGVLRREGLSARCAGEQLVIGVALLGVARLVGVPSPVLFFVALYLASMRVRLLVDAGNRLAIGGRAAMAAGVYGLALRLATNPRDRLVVEANRGAALLHWGQVTEAIADLEKVLSWPSGLGLRLETACRCNLGLAYLRQGQRGRARVALREAMDLLPGSIFARRAQMALQEMERPAAEQ